MLATIVLFSRFAVLFCSLMGVTLLYVNVLLAPMLLLCGPTAAPSAGASRSLLRPWGRWHRPRHALSAADAAAAAETPSDADLELPTRSNGE